MFIRKWYVSIALKCKVSYLRRQVSYLLRHLLTLWLITQGVNIISAAYAQSFQSNHQSILQLFEILIAIKVVLGHPPLPISKPLVICEPLVVICVMSHNNLCTVIATLWINTCQMGCLINHQVIMFYKSYQSNRLMSNLAWPTELLWLASVLMR